MNSRLEKVVKILTDSDIEYLTQKVGFKNLELFKIKYAYPYEYMSSFKKFREKNCLIKMFFQLCKR